MGWPPRVSRGRLAAAGSTQAEQPLATSPVLAAPVPEPATDPDGGAFSWYAAAAGSWFAGWGMNSALFAWLVAGELRAGDAWVGVAQSSTLWPALALLLLGGAIADRVDPRRLLVVLHVAAAAPVAALAAGVGAGLLSFPALVAYGLCLGTVSAFAMPARDALLSRVAGPDLMRSVTVVTAIQFGAQALGAAFAANARWMGSATALLVQGAVLLAGSAAAHRLPPAPPPSGAPRAPSAWHDVASGLAVVRRTPRLRGTMRLVIAVGLLFIGPFLALFPGLVVQRYEGGVGRLALVSMCFPLGTIAGSLALRARGGVRRKGRAALGSLVCGALALGSVGLGLPFPGMVAATVVWGIAGAVFITCSRTLYQAAAPDEQLGRVLAVYQLGFIGTAPIGSLAAGFASTLLGPLPTLRLCSLAMLAVVAFVALRTDTARAE
jgi:MFS family permease